jgi:fatty-acyl-CoA synthase
MPNMYGPDYPSTLGALITWAGLDPAAPAVTDAAGTLDRRGFQDRVLRAAATLRGAGVGLTSRVALWLPNGIDYLAAIFACARLGATAVHINTRFRAVEVGVLLRRSRASVIVTKWGFAAIDFPAILAALPAEDRAALRVVLGLGLPDGVSHLAGLPVLPFDDASMDEGPESAAGTLPCLTFTTSGTTSGPKLVLHCQGAIAGHAVDVCRRLALDAPGAALLAAVPFCGTFGNAAAMAAMAGGAHVVCLDRFDGVIAAGLIRRHGITHLIGGDDMIGRIAAACEGRPFNTIRFSGFAAFHSTAATSIAAAEAAGMHPHGVYGSSEIQALFATGAGANRLLAGGLPVNPQARLAVRDLETGAPQPPGASGELWIDAPSRFAGYLEDQTATDRAIGPDGMFRTGDLARLEGDGFVYEARIGDAMRLGGFLVNPEEIESFLQSQPGVAGVQVVSAAVEATDPVPVAFVRMDNERAFDEHALRALCRERLARFKVPERIVMLNAFPITDSPNGPKIQRARLREMAEALLRGLQYHPPRKSVG